MPTDPDGRPFPYGVKGIPAFVVIDADGVVTYRHEGSGEATVSALTTVVESVLQQLRSEHD